jgi:hypothetical protein
MRMVWRRLRFWSGMQVAIAASVSIELVQYLASTWGSYRAVDRNDVILNVLGRASAWHSYSCLCRSCTGAPVPRLRAQVRDPLPRPARGRHDVRQGINKLWI